MTNQEKIENLKRIADKYGVNMNEVYPVLPEDCDVEESVNLEWKKGNRYENWKINNLSELIFLKNCSTKKHRCLCF